MVDIQDKIKQKIAASKVLLFMKGSPDFPQCGFSMKAANALRACRVEYDYVDVLAEPEYRTQLPKVSDWPTFPQLFINGELVGGCDIIVEMYQQGELQKELQQTVQA